MRMACSYAFKIFFLKNVHPLWILLLFRTASQGTLSARLLVCPLEAQGKGSTNLPPYFCENQKLCHFMITMPRLASNYHITQKSSSVQNQQMKKHAEETMEGKDSRILEGDE